MNGEIIIIMCEISHTPNCTEWMANWRDLPRSPYSGVSRLYCFTFFLKKKNFLLLFTNLDKSRSEQLFFFFFFLFYFIASLRCWKIMSCDETLFCIWKKKPHCWATPFFTSRLNSIPKRFLTSTEISTCLLYQLKHSCEFFLFRVFHFYSIDKFHIARHGLLLLSGRSFSWWSDNH